jgi:hypothetical protein
VAGRRALVELVVVVAHAIEADRRAAHQHPRLPPPVQDRARDPLGGGHAARANVLEALCRPAPFGDRLARQVDHGVRALHLALDGVPADGRRRRAPRDDDDLVTPFAQRSRESATDETRTARDEHPHAPSARDGLSALSRGRL